MFSHMASFVCVRAIDARKICLRTELSQMIFTIARINLLIITLNTIKKHFHATISMTFLFFDKYSFFTARADHFFEQAIDFMISKRFKSANMGTTILRIGTWILNFWQQICYDSVTFFVRLSSTSQRTDIDVFTCTGFAE